MNIDIQSTMRFGDEVGLKDFFFVHRLVHQGVDAVIATRGNGVMPNAAIDSTLALAAWLAFMRQDDVNDEERYALNDWLQLHDQLHQDEYAAFGLGQAPTLGSVDFSNDQQFYDWMFVHGAVHDTLNLAAGITS